MSAVVRRARLKSGVRGREDRIGVGNARIAPASIGTPELRSPRRMFGFIQVLAADLTAFTWCSSVCDCRGDGIELITAGTSPGRQGFHWSACSELISSCYSRIVLRCRQAGRVGDLKKPSELLGERRYRRGKEVLSRI